MMQERAICTSVKTATTKLFFKKIGWVTSCSLVLMHINFARSLAKYVFMQAGMLRSLLCGVNNEAALCRKSVT